MQIKNSDDLDFNIEEVEQVIAPQIDTGDTSLDDTGNTDDTGDIGDDSEAKDDSDKADDGNTTYGNSNISRSNPRNCRI